MRLADLNPQWMDAGGEGVTKADGSPAPKRHGVGVLLTCPCGACGEDKLLYVPFENPLDGGPSLSPERPLWTRSGDTFEALTLTPSILRNPSRGGCGWHGYVTNGEIVNA